MNRATAIWIGGALLALLTACQGGGDAQFYNDQGIDQLRHDQYDQARLSFKKALEITPKDGVIWGNLGVALSRLEQYDAALEAYHKANELAPGDPITVAEIASVTYRLGRYAEAEAGFRDAIRLEPAAPEFHSSLSLALLRQGKAEEAQAELDKALPEADKRGLVRYQQAAFLLIQGHTDQALDTFSRSLAAYPAGARSAVSDPDFEPLYDNPRFQSLVGDWWRPAGAK
jgi:tetratricopeptide (TPR) repeat protein